MSPSRHDIWPLGEHWVDQGRPKILIIDNYDSFTYNLVQMLATNQVAIEVVRNDRLTVEEVLDREVDALVLSPGPGRPEDAGICVELLRRRPRIPSWCLPGIAGHGLCRWSAG